MDLLLLISLHCNAMTATVVANIPTIYMDLGSKVSQDPRLERCVSIDPAHVRMEMLDISAGTCRGLGLQVRGFAKAQLKLG